MVFKTFGWILQIKYIYSHTGPFRLRLQNFVSQATTYTGYVLFAVSKNEYGKNHMKLVLFQLNF